MERRLRRGATAASLERGRDDQGSTLAIGAAFSSALMLAPPAALSKRGRLPTAVGAVGNAMMAVGIGLRWWAARTLGESYTRTLRTRPGQRVVDSGPYAVVRHPGYAADLLMWLGFGLSWMNTISVAIAAGPMIAAHGYRIMREETMLRESLGDEYRSYAARTARLIPGIY